MQIIFYRTPAGQEPVREYLLGLSLRERAATADILDAIQEYGLQAPGVRFRQVKGKLWEFYVEAGTSHRIFYIVITGPMMVLLHSYKKQSRKAPVREVKIAELRMKEVLYES